MSVITINAVSKAYGAGPTGQVVLDSINLEFQRGEFTVLAGPSGSGKTTLLNLMGALDVPTSGDIVFMGERISHLSPNRLADFRLRRLGFVFQAYNLINVLTARENVEYVMLLQGLPAQAMKQRAIEVLRRVGLAEHIDRRPSEMSGGQQQRVAVARSIVSMPDLVLADEPTANLDSKTGEDLIALMKSLNQERGMTFVLSSHDPMVMEHAKRIIRLKDGRVVSDELRS